MNNYYFNLFILPIIFFCLSFSIRYQQSSYFNSEMSYFDTQLYAACVIT